MLALPGPIFFIFILLVVLFIGVGEGQDLPARQAKKQPHASHTEQVRHPLHRPQHPRNPVWSELRYCDRELDCALLQGPNVTKKEIAQLRTLSLCPAASWRTIRPVDMTKEAFLNLTVQAFQRRRALCEAEHDVVALQLEGERVDGKAFTQRDGFPVYGSFDLLAASLISLSPKPPRHSLPSLWLELGVAEGASLTLTALVVARRNLSSLVAVHGFDSFLGLPESWRGLLPAGFFSTNGVPLPLPPNAQVHVGLFNETLRPFFHAHACTQDRGVVGMNVDNSLYAGAFYGLSKAAHCLRAHSLLHLHSAYHHSHPQLNPMDELLALYDFMLRFNVSLQLLPVRNSQQEAAVFSVLRPPFLWAAGREREATAGTALS